MSKDTDLFAFQLKAAKIPFVQEHRFHATRRWRFDFWIESASLAVEIDGGMFAAGGGGHTRGRSRINDMTRDAEAMLMSIRVLRAPPEWVKPGILLAYVERLIRLPESEQNR